MTHDRRHEEWLAELATGGADPQSHDTFERLERCPACADGWAELQRTQTALDRALRGERELVTALRRAAPAPGEDRALATLRAVLLQGAEAAPAHDVSVKRQSTAQVHSQASHLPAVHAPADDSPSGSTPRARSGLRPGARWALVAAGLICAFAIGWSLRAQTTRGTPRTDVMLGEKIELVAPLGPEASFDGFRWNYDLAAGELVEIVVRYRGLGGEGMMTETYRVFAGNEWIPSRAISDKWPAEISWSVCVVGSSGLVERRSDEVVTQRTR